MVINWCTIGLEGFIISFIRTLFYKFFLKNSLIFYKLFFENSISELEKAERLYG